MVIAGTSVTVLFLIERISKKVILSFLAADSSPEICNRIKRESHLFTSSVSENYVSIFSFKGYTDRGFKGMCAVSKHDENACVLQYEVEMDFEGNII